MSTRRQLTESELELVPFDFDTPICYEEEEFCTYYAYWHDVEVATKDLEKPWKYTETETEILDSH
jgi:hypothetical protein